MNSNINSSAVAPILSRPSFYDVLDRVMEQIEMQAIDLPYWDRAKELCLIITEVYLMNPKAPISVCGERLDADLVQQIFRCLTCEHVKYVLENFEKVTERIKNKKAYMRTALYNSVFELEAHYQNEVAYMMGHSDRQ